jgi:hypothetical protein
LKERENYVREDKKDDKGEKTKKKEWTACSVTSDLY